MHIYAMCMIHLKITWYENSFDANYVVRLSQADHVQNTIQCMHIYEMCMIHLKITWYENVRVSSKHHTVHAYIRNVHDSSKNRIVI